MWRRDEGIGDGGAGIDTADYSDKTVAVAVTLGGATAAKVQVDVKWVGFEIPNEFVVGYGLDYDERYRTLKGVAVLSPEVYG